MSSEKITESEDVVDESVIGEAVDEAPLRLIVHTEDGAQSTTIERSAKVCDLPAGNKFEPGMLNSRGAAARAMIVCYF